MRITNTWIEKKQAEINEAEKKYNEMSAEYAKFYSEYLQAFGRPGTFFDRMRHENIMKLNEITSLLQTKSRLCEERDQLVQEERDRLADRELAGVFGPPPSKK